MKHWIWNHKAEIPIWPGETSDEFRKMDGSGQSHECEKKKKKKNLEYNEKLKGQNKLGLR